VGPNALKWLNEFNEARKQLRFFFRTFVAFSLRDYYPVVHYFIDLVVEMFGEDAVTPKMAMSLIVVPYFVSKYESLGRALRATCEDSGEAMHWFDQMNQETMGGLGLWVDRAVRCNSNIIIGDYFDKQVSY
jgi:hypothetical protein